ncbi:MAG: RICIN domain-containing protein [Lachnospiraceae bacterium]|nr:RICIN domain-containing protein [Lachnospiraceae bacterium]
MKGRLLFIFTVLVFLLSFGRVRTVSADEMPASGTYVIHSALAENKVLDIAGASKRSGGNLQLYDGNSSEAQQFTLTRLSDGTYHISPVCSALALDVEGAKAASGTNVRQYTANGTRAQRWRLIPAENGTFGIEPVCAPGFCLDIAGASIRNGTNARLYAGNGTPAQRFSFEKIDGQRVAPNGIFTFASAINASKVIDVYGGLTRNGANVQLYASNGTAAQQFTLSYLGDGWYTITNVKAKKVLDVAGGSRANCANIQLYTSNQTAAQKWRFEERENGTFSIVSALGKTLDVAGGSSRNGTNIRTYTDNGTAAQRFSFQPVIPAAEDTPAPAQGRQYIVAIDPGHQRHGSSALEPNAPGSSVMKARVTSGTEGLWSGLEEYDLNLRVGLKLRAELEARGYSVYMIRTTHDVDISNAERAQMAASAHADIFIRLHANSSDSPSVRGVMAYQPSSANRYLSSSVIANSQRLSELLVAHECAATGFLSRGILDGDDMTGINWASMPVSIIEMGFMSNREDDLYMASEAGQSAIARGLANGVDAYFGK